MRTLVPKFKDADGLRVLFGRSARGLVFRGWLGIGLSFLACQGPAIEGSAHGSALGTVPSPSMLPREAAETVLGGEGPRSMASPLRCPVKFRYAPPEGSARRPQRVTLMAEANRWSWDADPLEGPDASGAFTKVISMPPGLQAYKFVVDGVPMLDPSGTMRKYVGGIENSAVEVDNCLLPRIELSSKTVQRPASGQGVFRGTLRFVPGVEGAALDPSTVRLSLRHDGNETPLEPVSMRDGAFEVEAKALSDGKYTIFASAADALGRVSPRLRLVFWVESERFDWRDATIYMAMTDRFKNGDLSNDPPKLPGVDERVQFKGGDLQGVRDVVRSGALDRLGVRALWLSPFNTNPQGAYKADDKIHDVMGYHGYWPVKAREVDPRIGGAEGLRALVREAHAHGIRILQDFVVNHVHEQHEYVAAHPDWFRTGCVCNNDEGPNGCGWTSHRLDCLFEKYLPDVNWSIPAVSDQFSADAIYWLDEFDLDGLRIDAVKHVEDAAIANMATRIRKEFEASGTKVFLTGETAMGWNDCDVKCNADQYGTIRRYMGPNGLDGQFDFVLYHAVAYRTFSYGDRGMMHADYWTRMSLEQYPQDAIMTPYIGSHDTPRSLTLATYRGQNYLPRDVPFRKWYDIADRPRMGDTEPFHRHQLALAWLLTLPGAPLLYYGDEYGEWGGGDPNNRGQWRGDKPLSREEEATLRFTEQVGMARRQIPALRRGSYQTLSAMEDTLVTARKADGSVAIVGLSRNVNPVSLRVQIPRDLGLVEGTELVDRIQGTRVPFRDGAVVLSIPPHGITVLTP